jgi:hypothetical protein
MSNQGMILDYAGPRKRSRFRMASRSLIECRAEDVDDGRDLRIVIREWLDGQEKALWFIAASIVMLTVAARILIAIAAKTPVGAVVFQSALITAGFALIPLVVQQSWRQTVLSADSRRVALVMGGPLARRRFAWDVGQVEALHVILTQNREGAALLGEVELLAAGTPPVRLFTDHFAVELRAFVERIHQAMKGEGPA